MSLINKMLQDLDARAGTPGAAPLPGDVRLAAPAGRRLPWPRIALGVAAVTAAAGYAGWHLLDRGHAEVAPPVVALAAKPAPAALPAPIPAAVAAAGPQGAPEPEAVPAAQPQPAPAARVQSNAASRSGPARTPAAVPPPVNPGSAQMTPAGRIDTSVQRADNVYRRALGALEDGRMTEAIAMLQAALAIDPRHEPSRQTLVGLLVEAGRHDEAMRELQATLTLDARQPALAMLLARLQLERGGAALATLERTLPHAAGDAGYQAFIAGVLQREGRHERAVEHYGRALKLAPHNGVWWMGLGLSLQATGQDAQALDAFGRARASGTLSPDLLAFVERRLAQLAH